MHGYAGGWIRLQAGQVAASRRQLGDGFARSDWLRLRHVCCVVASLGTLGGRFATLDWRWLRIVGLVPLSFKRVWWGLKNHGFRRDLARLCSCVLLGLWPTNQPGPTRRSHHPTNMAKPSPNRPCVAPTKPTWRSHHPTDLAKPPPNQHGAAPTQPAGRSPHPTGVCLVFGVQ